MNAQRNGNVKAWHDIPWFPDWLIEILLISYEIILIDNFFPWGPRLVHLEGDLLVAMIGPA